MSIIKNAKEFFGLGPLEVDDTYYADDYRFDYREPTHSYDEHYGRHHVPTYERPSVVRILSYRDAAEVGRAFRDSERAVVIDMSAAGFEEAKRVLDFASGLCYALRGTMIKLDRQVFGLVPTGVSASERELRDVLERHRS